MNISKLLSFAILGAAMNMFAAAKLGDSIHAQVKAQTSPALNGLQEAMPVGDKVKVKIGEQAARFLESGEALKLKVGQKVELIFESMSGYSWYLASDKLPGLTFTGSKDTPPLISVARPRVGGIVSADKIRAFTFVAEKKAAKQHKIKFDRKRGEKGVVAQTMEVLYTVSR